VRIVAVVSKITDLHFLWPTREDSRQLAIVYNTQKLVWFLLPFLFEDIQLD